MRARLTGSLDLCSAGKGYMDTMHAIEAGSMARVCAQLGPSVRHPNVADRSISTRRSLLPAECNIRDGKSRSPGLAYAGDQ